MPSTQQWVGHDAKPVRWLQGQDTSSSPRASASRTLNVPVVQVAGTRRSGSLTLAVRSLIPSATTNWRHGRRTIGCMEIDFVRDGLPGRVTVSCVTNSDPAAYGTPEIARGFPVCTTTVQYLGLGDWA